MFRDDFWFARVQTQIPDQSLDACAPMRGILETSLHYPLALPISLLVIAGRSGRRVEGRRILVGSAQTCQGRRPSLGRANGDAGMTHLVFRVDRNVYERDAKATG